MGPEISMVEQHARAEGTRLEMEPASGKTARTMELLSGTEPGCSVGIQEMEIAARDCVVSPLPEPFFISKRLSTY